MYASDRWQTKVHFLIKLGLHSFEVYNHKQQTSFLVHLINMFQQVSYILQGPKHDNTVHNWAHENAHNIDPFYSIVNKFTITHYLSHCNSLYCTFKSQLLYHFKLYPNYHFESRMGIISRQSEYANGLIIRASNKVLPTRGPETAHNISGWEEGKGLGSGRDETCNCFQA